MAPEVARHILNLKKHEAYVDSSGNDIVSQYWSSLSMSSVIIRFPQSNRKHYQISKLKKI